MKKKIIIRRCIVDGKPFKIELKLKRGKYVQTHGHYKRELTCSRKCTREYIRNRRIYLKNRRTTK